MEQASTSRQGGESNLPYQGGLYLLSLDSGGVQGLSTLYRRGSASSQKIVQSGDSLNYTSLLMGMRDPLDALYMLTIRNVF